MKLTSAQVERALSQFEAQAVTDDHPAVEQLRDAFGDHTFFLDGNGLNIVEPTDPARGSAAQVINLANWGDDDLTILAAHDPEPTNVVIVLATN